MSDQRKERPETILDDPALGLKAQRTGDMEGEPTLRPAYYENNPRLVVKTKVPNDKNNGKIEAAMSNHAFFSMLRALESVANSKEPTIVFMDNKGHRFVDKKRDPNPSIMSVIKLEKNHQGIVSICISAGKNRPQIEFPFIDPGYHNFRNGDGQMPIGQSSRFYALGWVDVMREYMGKVIERNYERPAWMNRDRQGGGFQGNNGGYQNNRQGGNNNGGNNYQGNRAQSAPAPTGGNDFSFDDDVPL